MKPNTARSGVRSVFLPGFLNRMEAPPRGFSLVWLMVALAVIVTVGLVVSVLTTYW